MLPLLVFPALLFAYTTLAAPSTPNDPFHAISALAARPQEHPVCCLKPLTPLEPVDEDIFLSFEEWKTRRIAEDTVHKDPPSGTGPNAGHEPAVDPGAPPKQNTSAASSPAPAHADVLDNPHAAPPNESLSPHFRVPLTDRFNYASLDCSARVHTAHRGAKSVANILSGKKDRYMLSPCAAPRQFVVVELCDDIRIDTVQLANFEFFSGVFKEFTVSVSKTYTTEPEGWTVVGTYMAKNVRGVQSFHPPTSVRDFYRFIRIDFHSHYGNEYYCPISLLRVYGLTHLEQYKWDIWEAESRARQEQVAPVAIPAEVVEEPPQPAQTPEIVDSQESSSESEEAAEGATKSSEDLEGYMRHSTDIARSGAPTGETVTPPPDPSPAITHNPSAPTNTTGSVKPRSADDSSGQHTLSPPNGSTTATTASVSLSPRSEPTISISASSGSLSHTHSIPPDSPPKHPHTDSSSESLSPSLAPSSSPAQSPSASTISLSASTLISLPVPAPPYLPSSGESIYRTIMNRLTALEANNTLYARYVEEQTAGIREVLRRLGEDVGRLEGLGKAQAQVYQRATQDLERQRRRMEVEQRELITKVNYLADEIVLEKRLGILQLCLLLAVLVFLGLTRGSRSELLEARRVGATTMREWGRRNLSLSGDWVSRFRGRSRSLTPSPGDATPVAQGAIADDKVRFPSRSAQPAPPVLPGKSRQYRGVGVGSGPSTPTGSRRAAMGAPRTPRYHGLQRSNSHGSPGQGSVVVLSPVPRSARRWARSAHLHEVRRDDAAAKDGGGRHASPLRVVTNRVFAMGEGAEQDADGWVDTDAEEECVGGSR